MLELEGAIKRSTFEPSSEVVLRFRDAIPALYSKIKIAEAITVVRRPPEPNERIGPIIWPERKTECPAPYKPPHIYSEFYSSQRPGSTVRKYVIPGWKGKIQEL